MESAPPRHRHSLKTIAFVLALTLASAEDAAADSWEFAPDLRRAAPNGYQTLLPPEAFEIRMQTAEWLKRYLAGIRPMQCSSKIQRINNSRSTMEVTAEVAGDETYSRFFLGDKQLSLRKWVTMTKSWIGSGNFEVWPATLLTAIENSATQFVTMRDGNHHVLMQYDVSEADSDWNIFSSSGSLRPGYRVVATLNEKSGRLVRLQISSTSSFKMAHADQIVEFTEFAGDGASREVPVTSVYKFCNTSNRCIGTRETFSHYRFSETLLQFPVVDSFIYFGK